MSILKSISEYLKFAPWYVLIFCACSAIISQTIAQEEDAAKILLTFSEPMSRETIFDTNNYVVISGDNEIVEIFKVGVVEGDTAVVLYVDGRERFSSYSISVKNLKDKAGNLIDAQNNFANVVFNDPEKSVVNLKKQK